MSEDNQRHLALSKEARYESKLPTWLKKLFGMLEQPSLLLDRISHRLNSIDVYRTHVPFLIFPFIALRVSQF
jgi:hypothetical protein